MMLRLILFVLILFMTPSSVLAEHRVALLIGQKVDGPPPSDLNKLANQLKQFGFRSTLLQNVTGKQIQSALDAFAESTPTRGTALVYYQGPVVEGNSKGKTGSYLTGSDAKLDDPRSVGSTGYRIDSLLERLSTQGGSSINLVVLHPTSDLQKPSTTPPADCALFSSSLEKFEPNADLVTLFRKQSEWFTSSLSPTVAITGAGSTAITPPTTFMLGTRAGDEWVDGRGTVFCWCPPGKYQAGSPITEKDRYPDELQKTVVMKEGFWISKYEMTLRENLRNHPRNTLAEHKNDPLTMINHDDAKRMLLKTLTEREHKAGRLPSGWQYSLPTEDQWEYAARAGSTTRFCFGNDIQLLPKYANFGDRSFYETKGIYSNSAHRTLDDGEVHPVMVGSYLPNAWGLHDVHGNVAEWCINTAIRGGSWVSVPMTCRCAYRDSFSSRNEQTFIGYRIVIQTVPQEAN